MQLRNQRILLLVFLIGIGSMVFNPMQVWGTTSGTINIRVSGGNDDAEEDVSDGDMDLGSSDLEMIREDEDQIVGIRFQNVSIPQGATITNAYIVFTVDEVTSETTSLNIWGQKHINGSIFSSSDNNISNRDKTDAEIIWNNIPAWGTVDEEGVAQQTPDISNIVQEIVDQSFWAGGNAMVFIIEGIGKRVARSYNSSSSKAPLLHVEYTSDVIEVAVIDGNDDAEQEDDGDMYIDSTDLELVSDGSRGNQTVGIRFQDVQVPQGALITNAYIVFETDETTSESTSVTIKGETSSDAQAFTTTNNNISDRSKTGQSVEWNSIAAWNTWGEKHQTPDLSAIVQEIVGNEYWISGNAMAFIITGSGKRTAGSYEDSDNAAPLLHIEYSDDLVPFITVDKTTIGASATKPSSPDDTSLTLSNTGGSQLTYTIADNADWLTLSSTGGSPLNAGASADYTVSFSTSGLDAGTYEATISITAGDAPNSPVEIQVSMTVFAAPESSSCGNVPLYAENLVSPAILVLLDISSSMESMMDVSDGSSNPKTPDLSAIVQEIIDRENWSDGNSMSFIITGSGHRTAKSYDGSSGSAPLLHVEYTYSGDDLTLETRVSQSTDDAEEKQDQSSVYLDSSDLELVNDGDNGNQTIGIRFQNVTIPKNTVGNPVAITNAYIEFVIDESQTETTNLTIWGHDFDDSSTFANNANDISDRTTTSESVDWNNVAEWAGVTQQSRIEIGKAAISDLVTDRAISWGYGTWCFTGSGYTESIDFTKVHIGTKPHTEDHQTALQAAIAATYSYSGTPFGPSVVAAKEYFAGNKSDDAGDDYVDSDCQPRFLIDVTDGQGYLPHTSVELIDQYTTELAESGVTAIGVGFGLDPSEAAQLYKLAEVANDEGGEDDDDDIYALHEEVGGIAQPFFANNKQELVDALNAITENVKGAIFYGSAPAPTTSTDLGEMVIVAKFDASRWSGDMDAVTKDENGEWISTLWTASDEIPGTRNLWTVTDPDDPSTKSAYTASTLTDDNFQCHTDKPIGDIINSTPVVVGKAPFWYPFDGYMSWARSLNRDTMVYVGANDGFLHAFKLVDGEEKWAFLPQNLHAKLNQADDPLYDRCDPEYCHQYYVDGNPIAADVYADFDSDSSKEWRTMLITGERKGGQAYFALDITSGNYITDANPTNYLWQFTDSELGETWSDPSVDRVAIKDVDPATETAWGVFLGSGYLPVAEQQDDKEAYLYAIEAHDANAFWKDANNSNTNRIRIAPPLLGYDNLTTAFTVGEQVTGQTSGATATIVAIDSGDQTLTLDDESGSFQSSETLVGSLGGGATVSATLTGILENDALASPLVVDVEGDHLADRIYVGNLYGNMYRITDIGKDMTPQISTLFSYENTSPNENPIRARADFGYTETDGEIWVYFGSGRFESQADKQDSHQQYFFGLKDSSTPVDTYTPADLVNLQAKFATTTIDSETVTVRYVAGSNSSKLPWKLQLYENTFPNGPTASGTERVVSQPLVVGNVVIFTTFIPDENVCSGSGETYVFALNYKTGLAPGAPIFDLDGDEEFGEDDKVTVDAEKIVPVGKYVGRGRGSKPVLHGDVLFITTTDSGLVVDDNNGGGGQQFFAEKINIPAQKVRLEAWRHQ